MGTNYYGRIIPTKEQKENLCNLVMQDNFHSIWEEVKRLYGSPELDYVTDSYIGGEIHLGKRSGGWKFLWNPNIYKIRQGHTIPEEISKGVTRYHWVEDPYTVFKYYDLTRESIKVFIDREDVEIWDEYNEKQDKEEFWNMALDWTTWNGKEAWDGKSYELYEKEKNPNRRCYDYRTEYCDFLIEQGFNVEWPYTDFYSDNLRFATNTEFC